MVVRLLIAKFLDQDHCDLFKVELPQAVGDATPKVIIDFGEVTFLSSAALGPLKRLGVELRAAGNDLRLCCICPEVLEVFTITKLDRLFQIHNTLQEALDSL